MAPNAAMTTTIIANTPAALAVSSAIFPVNANNTPRDIITAHRASVLRFKSSAGIKVNAARAKAITANTIAILVIVFSALLDKPVAAIIAANTNPNLLTASITLSKSAAGIFFNSHITPANIPIDIDINNNITPALAAF